MVSSVSIPVTAKLRSGFEDTSLFEENICAAAESGIAFLTLHPRTKVEGYKPPANWDLIRRAKNISKVPIVGNGDIITPADAQKMLNETGCDSLMIGRGAVINPWIFHEIRGNVPKKRDIAAFVKEFCDNLPVTAKPRNHVNQLKQLSGFLFQRNKHLAERRMEMLRGSYADGNDFLFQMLPILREHWT